MIYEDLEFLTPYMHTADDTVGKSLNSPDSMKWNARLGAAGIATLAGRLLPRDGTPFRRGDANADGVTGVADVVFMLQRLFASGPRPPCEDAADANDDGRTDLSDPVMLLLHLFGQHRSLPAPVLACGTDPTLDSVPCAEYPSCPSPR